MTTTADTAEMRVIAAVAAIDHLHDRLDRAGIDHTVDYTGCGSVTVAPRSAGGALILLHRLACRSIHRDRDPECWVGRTPGMVQVRALIDTTGRGATTEAAS